jgi:hypothetical protein
MSVFAAAARADQAPVVPAALPGIAGASTPSVPAPSATEQSTQTSTSSQANTGTAGAPSAAGPDNINTDRQATQTPPVPDGSGQSAQSAAPPQAANPASTNSNTDSAQQAARTMGAQPPTSGSTGQSPSSGGASAGSTGQSPSSGGASAGSADQSPSSGGTTDGSTGSTATSPVTSALTLAAESNATTQSIWQVQISGCTANCLGVTQTQVAAQQNTAVQVVAGVGELATPSPSGLAPTGGSSATSSITQIQAGCISQCFGTTTTGAAVSQAVQQALGQVLAAALATAGIPPLQSPPATTQNAVDQTSHQWQLSQGASASQAQGASQIVSTVQSVASSVSAAVQAAVGAQISSVGAVVNHTEQGIWQVQIGCLIFCAQTQQSQRAYQSSTTIQVLESAPGAVTQTVGAAVNITTQIIWQLQIGCLMWCLDTTEQQFASSAATTVVAIIGPMPTGSNPPPSPTLSGGPWSDTAPPGAAPPGATPSDPARAAVGTGPEPPAPPAGLPFVTTEPSRLDGTPARASSTVTLSSIPFTTGVAQGETGSATRLVASLTPSGTAVGNGSKTPVITRLPAPRSLIAHLGSGAIAVSAALGPTTRIAGPAGRRGLSHRGGHGPAQILPMPARSPLAGPPEPAKAAAAKAGGMSSAALAAALAAAIALVALPQLRRRSTT